jgi:hypothetical protein
LVLNPRTGHASAQFHVKHDDFFETVSNKSTNFDSISADWKTLSRIGIGIQQRATTANKTSTKVAIPTFTRPIPAPISGHNTSADEQERVPLHNEVVNQHTQDPTMPLQQVDTSVPLRLPAPEGANAHGNQTTVAPQVTVESS